MSEIRDEFGNPVPLTDQYGNPVQLTDELGRPIHLYGIATTEGAQGQAIRTGEHHIGAHIPGTGIHVPGTGKHVPGSGAHVPGTGAHVPGTGAHMPGTTEGGGVGLMAAVHGTDKPKTVGEHLQQECHTGVDGEHRRSSSSSSSEEDDGKGGRIRKKKGLKEKIRKPLELGVKKFWNGFYSELHWLVGDGKSIDFCSDNYWLGTPISSLHHISSVSKSLMPDKGDNRAWRNCLFLVRQIQFKVTHIFRESNTFAEALTNFGAPNVGSRWWTDLPGVEEEKEFGGGLAVWGGRNQAEGGEEDGCGRERGGEERQTGQRPKWDFDQGQQSLPFYREM
ncbi:hypothetical protein ACLB2K_013084 [Fragaria x ananassa]